MDAPTVSLTPVIDSLCETENTVKTVFHHCSETISDILNYSSDKHGDLTKLKVCMNNLAESQKEIRVLAHAAREIRTLSDRMNLNKEDALERLDELFEEYLLEEDMDDNQKQTISSLESFINENQTSEEIEDDEGFIVTKTTQSYLDPLTKRTMTDPVKSKFCSHAYERSSILQYLSGSRKNCPYSGCRTMLRKEDLIDDIVLKMQLLSDAVKDES